MKNGMRAFHPFKSGIDYDEFISKVPGHCFKDARREKKYDPAMSLVAPRHLVLQHYSKVTKSPICISILESADTVENQRE